MKALAWVFLAAAAATAFENREAKEDAAALQLDGFTGFPGNIDSASGETPFSRAYGYSFFPIMKVAGRDLSGMAEFSILPRRFHFRDSALNGRILQSYGLGLGYETYRAGRQSGFAFGLFGINGDMRDTGPDGLYGDISYIHQFEFSDRLMIGGGLDFHYYFEGYFTYPVILLDWRVAEHTKIKINFDTGELKQFLTDWLSVSLGAQYDIFHYGFGRGKGYVMETTSGLLRLELRIGENMYARVSAKKPFWGGERIWTPTGTEMEAGDLDGMSLRTQIVYGI